jgi:hypothetical protein
MTFWMKESIVNSFGNLFLQILIYKFHINFIEISWYSKLFMMMLGKKLSIELQNNHINLTKEVK